MTQGWRAWLPWEVAEQAVVRTAVLDIIAGWTTDWFGATPFGAPEWRISRDAMPAPVGTAGDWIRRNDGVALHQPSNCQAELVGLALQLDPHQVDLTEADQQVMQSFGKRLVHDLLDRFDQRLAESAPGAGKGYLELNLALQTTRQGFRLYLPFHAVVALHRAARPLKPSRTRLGPMTAALADTPVPVRAFLGSATVSLDELRNLAPGDTLVLSTLLAGGVSVTAGGENAAFATAELLQDGGRPVLLLNP